MLVWEELQLVRQRMLISSCTFGTELSTPCSGNKTHGPRPDKAFETA